MAEDWETPENLDRLFSGRLQVGDVVMHADPVLRSCIAPGRVVLVMGTIVDGGQIGKGDAAIPVWVIECPDGQNRLIPKGQAVAMGCAGALPG